MCIIIVVPPPTAGRSNGPRLREDPWTSGCHTDGGTELGEGQVSSGPIQWSPGRYRPMTTNVAPDGTHWPAPNRIPFGPNPVLSRLKFCSTTAPEPCGPFFHVVTDRQPVLITLLPRSAPVLAGVTSSLLPSFSSNLPYLPRHLLTSQSSPSREQTSASTSTSVAFPPLSSTYPYLSFFLLPLCCC